MCCCWYLLHMVPVAPDFFLRVVVLCLSCVGRISLITVVALLACRQWVGDLLQDFLKWSIQITCPRWLDWWLFLELLRWFDLFDMILWVVTRNSVVWLVCRVLLLSNLPSLLHKPLFVDSVGKLVLISLTNRCASALERKDSASKLRFMPATRSNVYCIL